MARQGFSLIEVAIAIGIVSFALLSILGVLSIAMTVHQDASVDSVFSIMTESAMQELRNYNTPANSQASTATSVFNFNKLTGYKGYLYFDRDGQVTVDGYWNGNSGGVPTVVSSTTAAQSTEVGINMNGATLSANGGKAGVPLLVVPSPLPTTTYYTCTITTTSPLLSSGLAAKNMYLVKLTFTYPSNVAAANQHTRTVLSSISNTTN